MAVVAGWAAGLDARCRVNSAQLVLPGGGCWRARCRCCTCMRKRKARMRRFEEQFPDSLEFVARSMRAGHAFSVSLEMIHREFQEPLAGEFRRTFEEHNLGLPLDVALQKLAQARALAGRAVLRFRRAAAEAHRRQPGRDSGQAGLRDPRALQAARPHPRHQRARPHDRRRADLHSDRRGGA